MPDIMVDLETLGTVPGAAILSIGAVPFDTYGVHHDNTFHELIYTPSCLDVFLTVNGATQAWWGRQADEARTLLDKCKDPQQSAPVKEALAMFATYLQGFGRLDEVRVWGNGSDFDNALLTVAYDICGMPLPWKFFNNRCYRTLKNLHPDVVLERVGVYHSAVDDAVSQAEHAVRLLQRQENCVSTWGDLQDDGETGEGSGAPVQQEGAEGAGGHQRKADPAGNRVPRQNVPTGIRF